MKRTSRFMLVALMIVGLSNCGAYERGKTAGQVSPNKQAGLVSAASEQQDIAPGIQRLRMKRNNRLAIEYVITPTRTSEAFFHQGKRTARGQKCKYERTPPIQPDEPASPFVAQCGREMRFDRTGAIRRVLCWTPDRVHRSAHKCGLELQFDAHGKVVRLHRHPATCEYGCGEFRPLLEPGKYRVVVPRLTVHEEPDKKSQNVFQLKKDQKIAVTKDTHKIVTISGETAPWVKIRTADGREGFVFGGFIRGEKEPYVDMSRYVGK